MHALTYVRVCVRVFQSRTMCFCAADKEERERKTLCAPGLKHAVRVVEFERERGNKGWKRTTDRERERERERETEEADQLSGQRVAQKPNFTLQ